MRRQVVVTTSILVASVLGLLGIDTIAAPLQQQTSAQQRSYAWVGQLVAVDANNKTATIKAQILPHLGRYVAQLEPEDRVLVVWDMVGKTVADQVRAVWTYQEDESSSSGNTGYVLPVEFASADVSSQIVTFNVRVPDSVLPSLTSMESGQWIKVTAPMHQSSADATITSIEKATPPGEAAGGA